MVCEHWRGDADILPICQGGGVGVTQSLQNTNYQRESFFTLCMGGGGAQIWSIFRGMLSHSANPQRGASRLCK